MARLAALVVAVLAATGCSSGEDAAPPSATEPTPTALATPTSTTDLATGDQAEITAAFEAFFGGLDTTVDEKVALLVDGERYRAMLEAASANEQFQQMSTDVRSIRPGTDAECAALSVDHGCAVVTHDLLVGGFPMAAAIESPAVMVDGRWILGARAWCGAVEIGGARCPDGEQADP